VAHVPVANWLRPATSYLKRLCVGSCPDKWDEALTEKQLKICHKLQQDLDTRGDPVGGIWEYEPNDPWILYTDASKLAFGAALYIGNNCVEDSTLLRTKSDLRHINLAELLAFLAGLDLPIKYIRALKWEQDVCLILRIDSVSVNAWLTRSDARHWINIKGINKHRTQKALDNIADMCKGYRIKLKVELVKSEENLADVLTRVPKYMLQKEEPEFNPDKLAEVIMIVDTMPTWERDSFGRIILDDEKTVDFIKKIHRHEGANALWSKARELIANPRLRSHCQKFVKNCPNCSVAKPSGHVPVDQFNKDDDEINVPFQKVFMDVLGPYERNFGYPTHYCISLVDCYSRFAIVHPLAYTPTGKDCATVLRELYERFHISPDVVRVDRGTQFTSDDFCRTAVALRSRIVESPVDTSWTNGRVERIHRIINERLRANFDSNWTTDSNVFIELVKQTIREYNCTYSENTRRSPHDTIYNFSAFLYPELKNYRKLPRAETLENVPQTRGIQNESTGPKEGEIWKVRRKRTRKSEVIYQPCRIIEQVSPKIYKIQLPNQARVYEHVRNIAEISQEAYENLPENQKLPEENARPLRSLRGGGGM